MDDLQKIISKAERCQKEQGAWHNYYDDLARVHIPRMLGFAESHEPRDAYDDIFDSTPMHAARGLANTIGGLLRPDGGKWVKMKASNERVGEDYWAKTWLEESSNRLRAAMENPASRMRQCTGEVDLMLVVFGFGPFWLGENKDRNGLLFKSIPLKEAAVEWGDEGATAMYRFRHLKARQAAHIFGEENLGEQAREALKIDSDRKFAYIHAVYERGTKGTFKTRMPYSSLWIEKESKHVVTRGGFMEFPYIVPRMETAPGDDMPRSPAMVSLPDANTLQAMGETILTAGQRAADPPIFAPNDGTFSAANTFPGGISYYDVEIASQLRGNPIFPMQTGNNLPITRDMQRDVREQVFAAFFKNILNLPIQGPDMTATEVIVRQNEMKREIGPLFSRLEADYTAPMVERTFNIMLRAGAFPEIPPSLAGQDILFEYESPVKRVRSMIEIESARALKNEIIEISQYDRQAFDNFNSDEYVRFMSEAMDAPNKLLRDPTEVVNKRMADAEAASEASGMQQLQQVADIVKTGSEAASLSGMVEQ